MKTEPQLIMHPNEALLHTFYTAFQQKNPAGMRACYAANATFSDPAFPHLTGQEPGDMWQMLLSRAIDLELTFSGIEANETSGRATWVAVYTFTQTGRTVENHIQAAFTFQDGKIVTHHDSFPFYTWARQAFGLTGWLIGWTSFFRKKVQEVAGKNLKRFQERMNN